jgi:hypothetical protein
VLRKERIAPLETNEIMHVICFRARELERKMPLPA